MRELVRQHRFLLFRAYPVEKIHCLGLGIVVAGHLLFQKYDQKFPQLEVTWQEPKFFQHQLGATQPLGVLVFSRVLIDISFHFIAADQLPLNLTLDGKKCVFTGKLQNLVHRVEEFVGFLRRNLLFLCRMLLSGAGTLTRRFLRRSRLACLCRSPK